MRHWQLRESAGAAQETPKPAMFSSLSSHQMGFPIDQSAKGRMQGRSPLADPVRDICPQFPPRTVALEIATFFFGVTLKLPYEHAYHTTQHMTFTF